MRPVRSSGNPKDAKETDEANEAKEANEAVKTMLDPIADMLTRIRNAQRAGKKTVSFSVSKLKLAIANTLLERKFVEHVETVTPEGAHPEIVLTLKYSETSPLKRIPVIENLRRVSHEGCRVYVARGEIRKVKNGYGMAIISTSKGVMSGEEAYRRGLGGEYICEVW